MIRDCIQRVFHGALSTAALCSILGSFPILASAGPIYKWQDKEGRIHYSSKAPNADAKPAELPNITRGDLQLARIKLESCERHGGIDCQAGGDTDGSVICYDGYKQAAPLFRISCSSPKLEISDISELNEKGEFTVFVRNSKSVIAERPSVIIRPPDLATGIPLDGPPTIDPFGVAEFTFRPDSPTDLKEKPNHSQITVSCANCP